MKDLFEELEGISEGSGLSVDELLCLNAFLELHDYLSDAFVVPGCTSMMVPGDTTGEGALIAQNYDLSSVYAAAAVLIKVHRDDDLRLTSLSYIRVSKLSRR